jgi:hypothetical protein
MFLMRPDARVAVRHIFNGIGRLKKAYGREFEKRNRDSKFPIDGRLVGDIGEAIASADYGVKLHGGQKKATDGTWNGCDVQVKATFKENNTFTKAPPPETIVLCFRLYEDGQYAEVYNGPSEKLRDRYWGRDFTKQRRPTVASLRQLSAKKPTRPRIPRI